MMEILVRDRKANVNAVNLTQATPLHLACLQGNLPCIQYLIVSGADVNKGDDQGLTPLHLLIQANGSLKAVEYLLNNGAIPFAKDLEGVTPMHVAAWNGRVDLIRPLMAKGAKGPLSRYRLRVVFGLLPTRSPSLSSDACLV
jgi:ankyrin repeat protein